MILMFSEGTCIGAYVGALNDVSHPSEALIIIIIFFFLCDF